jgi:NADH-quinone oxidoreductase subunit J
VAETWQEVVFWIVAIVMAVSALRVVTTGNVVHAALYLVATLMGAATLYVLLLAEFVAWVQVLVYVGAIVVLMLFGIMLTRAPIGKNPLHNDMRLLSAVVAAGLFAVTSWIMIDAFSGQDVNLAVREGSSIEDMGTTAEEIGESIFSSYVWPFEVVSVLLLAALIGAVVIAKKDDR